MDDLGQFLTDRYDEAEALARAAMRADQTASARWTVDSSGDGRDETWRVADDDNYLIVYHVRAQAADASEEAIAAFIADMDPAHRLADIKLKRAILAAYAAAAEAVNPPSVCNDPGDVWYAAGLDLAVRQLGTEFAGHPAYKQEWAP